MPIRFLIPLVMLIPLTACSSPVGEHDFLLGEWKSYDGSEWSAHAYLGWEHCDTQDVIELRLSGFEDSMRTSNHRSYLRDPRGILRERGSNIDELGGNVSLPSNAINLQLNKGNAYAYLEHDESAVFIVQDGYIERWPVFPHDYGCD